MKELLISFYGVAGASLLWAAFIAFKGNWYLARLEDAKRSLQRREQLLDAAVKRESLARAKRLAEKSKTKQNERI